MLIITTGRNGKLYSVYLLQIESLLQFDQKSNSLELNAKTIILLVTQTCFFDMHLNWKHKQPTLSSF